MADNTPTKTDAVGERGEKKRKGLRLSPCGEKIPAKMEVAVIQYYRPSGTPSPTSTSLSSQFKSQYEYMLRRNWNFGAEVLTSGHISVTIEDRQKGEDIDIRVVANGPGVQAAMEEMLAWLDKRMKRNPKTGTSL